jgi:cytoskeleton protein RodZ
MKELGEFLKTERMRQGLELSTITQQTCISQSMLTALEEGDSIKIGTPLLVRSFARAYCRVLGIDATPVLERYTGETPRHERLDEGIRHFRARSLATRERTRLRLIMVVMTLITIGAVYFTAVWLPKRDGGVPVWSDFADGKGQGASDMLPPAPRVPSSEQTAKVSPGDSAQDGNAVRQPEAVADGEPSGQVVRRPVLTAAGVPPEVASNTEVPQHGHKLRIEAVQESWVEVRLDDKKVEGALLSPGQSRDWTVENSLRVLVGNAGGVKLIWDGKKLRSLGKSGQSARLRLPEDAGKF